MDLPCSLREVLKPRERQRLAAGVNGVEKLGKDGFVIAVQAILFHWSLGELLSRCAAWRSTRTTGCHGGDDVREDRDYGSQHVCRPYLTSLKQKPFSILVLFPPFIAIVNLCRHILRV